MKGAYPIVITPASSSFLVYIPDFNINTESSDIPSAIEMARDAIGIMGIDMEDEKEQLPAATNITDIKKEDNEIITLVDVDFSEYRRKNDLRAVKKNCTIPSWLSYEAEKAGLNFSAILQVALKAALGFDNVDNAVKISMQK